MDSAVAADTRDATETTGGFLDACGYCKTNADCKTGLTCVDLGIPDPRARFCAHLKSAVGDCSTLRLYRGTDTATTADGSKAAVCLAAVSCAAINNFKKKCPADFTKCGLAEGDGTCWARSGTEFVCTILCKEDLDCPLGSTCKTLMGATFCGW